MYVLCFHCNVSAELIQGMKLQRLHLPKKVSHQLGEPKQGLCIVKTCGVQFKHEAQKTTVSVVCARPLHTCAIIRLCVQASALQVLSCDRVNLHSSCVCILFRCPLHTARFHLLAVLVMTFQFNAIIFISWPLWRNCDFFPCFQFMPTSSNALSQL